MARYEGMDEIVERLQSRLAQGIPAPERSEPDMSLTAPGAAGASHPERYTDAVERIMRLLREAQDLRTLLGTARSGSLSQAELDDLLGLVGEVLQELWSCEAVLHRFAPQG
jgi:hypothetical protein